MKSIYLIGFMGTGKSTVGQALASYLNERFIDVDDYIQQVHQMDIPTIFNKFGEKTFRDYEVKALQKLKEYPIVATGGGVVEREENIHTMSGGFIIHLHASLREINRRLQDDMSRPLWNQSTAEIEQLFNERKRLYQDIATISIDTTNQSIEEIVRILSDKIQKYGDNKEN